MAVTVTFNLTDMNDGDSITGWSGSQGTVAADTGVYRESTASIALELRTSGTQYIWFTRASGTWNLSNTHIYQWLDYLFPADLQTDANGGICIRVGDGTNWGDWVVGGSNTYDGGWRCFVADTSAPYYTTSGTNPTLSSITQIGFGIRILNTGKNVESTFVDFSRYGDGFTITSGSTDNITMQDVYDYSDGPTAGWGNGRASGIIRKDASVYYVQGKLRFGDTASGDVDFNDTSQVLVFEDKDVAATLYDIIIQGNSGGTTNVIFGEKTAAGRGISGFIFKTEGTIKYDFTATDTDIDILGVYGCSFLDADTISLPVYSATREVLSTNFEGCGQIIPSTCTMTYCNFINADTTAILLSSTSFNITESNFINNPAAIEIDTAGAYTFNNLRFSGNTYDLDNSITDLTIDSYDLSNYDATQALGNGTTTGVGQSVTGDGNALGAVVFYLSKTGSPTGTVTANLYAHSGSYGTSSVPTGASLAASETLDVSTLTTTLQLVKFTFDNTYVPVNATNYVVTLEYSGGDVGNYVNVGTDSTGSHGGNISTYAGSWSATAGTDAVFYLRCGWVVVNATNGANPSALGYINSAGAFGTTSCYSYNANTTTYTDETTDINSATVNDVACVPIQATTQGDAIYFGDTSTFTGVTINVGTAGVYANITITWQYWNGSTWTAITDVDDNTTGFTVSGTNTVNFSEPDDWVGTTVNSVHRFWIRAQTSWTASQSVTTAPLATQGWIGATKVVNSVNLEVNGVVQNTQCYIVPTAGGTAVLNAAATTLVSGNEYKASSTINYSGDTEVTVRAREMGYLPFETTGTIDSGGLAITAVWLVDPNWKLVVSGVNISFTATDTITRASGDFSADGWIPVMSQVTVEGSAANDGTYTITAVGTTTVTVSSGITTAGAASGITLTFTRRSL